MLKKPIWSMYKAVHSQLFWRNSAGMAYASSATVAYQKPALSGKVKLLRRSAEPHIAAGRSKKIKTVFRTSRRQRHYLRFYAACFGKIFCQCVGISTGILMQIFTCSFFSASSLPAVCAVFSTVKIQKAAAITAKNFFHHSTSPS